MAKEGNKGSLPSDLKVVNRQMILNCYRAGEALTPNEVSGLVGLSRQTVSKAIEFFISKGILVPAGKGESTEAGGRRPKYYELSHEICFAAINAEDDTVRFTLFDLYMNILYSHTESIEKDPSFSRLEEVTARGASVLLKHLQDGQKITGISVTIRGLVDSAKKSVRYSPYYKNWKRDADISVLLQYFPDARVIALDKPVRTYARWLLEQNYEEYRDKRVLVIFSRGGMAAAAINRGHIENGTNSIIGEISFMVVSADGLNEKEYISRYISEKAVEKVIRDNALACPGSPLLKLEKIAFRDMFEASAAGDSLGRLANSYLADRLAVLIRNTNLVFDADKVVLIGEYANMDSFCISRIKDDLCKFIYYPDDYDPDIVCDKTPLDDMLVLGSASGMYHEFYKDMSLYTDTGIRI